MLSWERQNVRVDQPFEFTATFERSLTGNINVALIAIPTGIAIVALLGAVIFFRRRALAVSSLPPQQTVEIILPILKSDEKAVVESVLKHGSGVNQKIIVRDSGYSKAKVSKVLKSLGERGLVRLERIGRGNKVYLLDKLENKLQNSSGNNQDGQNSTNLP